jgi:hypothetical protein
LTVEVAEYGATLSKIAGNKRGRVHPELRRRDGGGVWARCAHSHAYTHSNAHTHTHGDPYAHTYSDRDAKCNTHCHTKTYTEASPDTSASADSAPVKEFVVSESPRRSARKLSGLYLTTRYITGRRTLGATTISEW